MMLRAPVPEAPVDEDRETSPGEDDVGADGPAVVGAESKVDSEPQPACMER